MKKVIFWFLCLLFLKDAASQVYPPILYKPTQYEYLYSGKALGLPNDTLLPPISARGIPNLAIKDNGVFVWDTTLKKWVAPTIAAGITAGDKGDITVTLGPEVWTIDNLAVTNAKINDVAWSKISGTPTTLSGYGISDTKANFNTALSDGNFVFDSDTASMLTNYRHWLAGYISTRDRFGLSGEDVSSSADRTHDFNNNDYSLTELASFTISGNANTSIILNDAANTISFRATQIRYWDDPNGDYAYMTVNDHRFQFYLIDDTPTFFSEGSSFGTHFGGNQATISAGSISTSRTYTLPNADGTFSLIDVANAWADGVKQTFNPNGTNSGFNTGAHTGDPSSPANGDVYYNSTANELRARINGAWVALGAGGGGVSDGDKGDITISGSGATYTIDNGVVTFAKMQAITDGRLLGAEGGTTVEEITLTAADFNLSSNTLSIDYTNGQAASGSTKGFLTSADWTTFNGKVSISGTPVADQMAIWTSSTTAKGDASYSVIDGLYPSFLIGGSGDSEGQLLVKDAAGTYGILTGGTGFSAYGSTTYKQLNFYSSTSEGVTPILKLQNSSGVKTATFDARIITDKLVGGLLDGGIHGDGFLGDSTSLATDNNGHMVTAIARQYGNASSVNAGYFITELANTNSGATQDHGASLQTSFKKSGANTQNYHYDLVGLSGNVVSGTMGRRRFLYMFDTYVTGGATLQKQFFIEIPKLKGALSGQNYSYLSDSSDFVHLDGRVSFGPDSSRTRFFNIDGTVRIKNTGSAVSDSTTYKPVAIDANGDVRVMSYWPTGGGGSGITTLNTLTASTQTFATGTSGSDFNISSSTSTHTFNIPTASGSNRGALSSSDWTTFNAKISGSGATDQIAFFSTSGTITGSTAFFVSDALYPSISIGGSGDQEGSLLVKDAAGTYGSVTGVLGFTAYGSSTYKRLQFYSYAGGDFLFELHNHSGTKTGDFKAGVVVDIDSTLSIGNSDGIVFSYSGKFTQYANSNITDGQVLIGHTSNGTFEKATLTAGAGIGITNGGGSITIASTNVENTFTPTTYNTTNVAASTANTTYYLRVGDVVHVWGTVAIDATTSLTISEMGMSLPVASEVSQVYEIAGTGSFEDNTVVQIKGDVTNNRAVFRFTPQSATNNTYSFHFTYKYFAP